MEENEVVLLLFGWFLLTEFVFRLRAWGHQRREDHFISGAQERTTQAGCLDQLSKNKKDQRQHLVT